jgi:aldose 1-epimerase
VIVLRSAALEAWVIPFGARLMQLWWLQAPEARTQGPRPLSLGFAHPDSYRRDRMSIGAVCGRYANRLADARVSREGQTWALDANHPLGHCIHGGHAGFGQQDWTVLERSESLVRLGLISPSGHMGFPGDCHAEVSYALDGHTLRWDARAELSAPCPLNLLQHSYWNLDACPDLSGHHLQVHAKHYHPTDARELPLPAAPVDGTPFDFRTERPIPLDQIDWLDAALCLDRPFDAGGLRDAGTLRVADLALQVRTDRPLLHIYAASGLAPTEAPFGVPHAPGAGFCLETEDLPNGPALGADVWCGPDRAYRHRTALAFTPLG